MMGSDDKSPLNATYYQVDKGIAVMLNFVEFDDIRAIDLRCGSDYDAEAIYNSFKKLGFDFYPRDIGEPESNDKGNVNLIRPYGLRNGTTEGVKEFLAKMASNPKLYNYNCLAVVIASHGRIAQNGGRFLEIASFDDFLNVECDIVQRFYNTNCPSLNGKPKLIFIQACQVDPDPGKSNWSMNKEKPTDDLFPTDILVAYSTIPGRPSFRNKEIGSIYLQEFSGALDKYANEQHFNCDLCEILANVQDKVNQWRENGYQQCPAFISHLRGKVILGNLKPRFETVMVPHFPGSCYFRDVEDSSSKVENDIYSAMIDICNHPGEGILVVVGESGVGKTFLMSKLLNAKMQDLASAQVLKQTTVVFWLNCFKWKGDSTYDSMEEAFDYELVKAAKTYDPDFDGFSLSRIIPYFLEKKRKRVLFVLDDMLNGALLQYFHEKLLEPSKLSCCVITTNADLLANYNLNGIVQKEAIQLKPLTETGVHTMFTNLFKLGKLSHDQLRELARLCSGLPLMASLIQALFRPSDDVAVWQDIYHELLSSVRNQTIETLGRNWTSSFNRLLQLFEFNFNHLPSNLQAWYYAFLLFEPSVPISVRELQILWGGVPVALTVRSFKEASLVRVETSVAADQHLFVHQMLWNATLVKAKKEFKLISDDTICLEQIRMKLLKRELKMGQDENDEDEMIMFEVVRQQRLAFCRRLIEVVSAENLAELCKEHSKRSEDLGKSFLHFLYHSKWRQDVTYPSGHRLHLAGVNNSYRLIKTIFQKLKSCLEPNAILSVVNCKPADAREWRTLLIDALETEDKGKLTHTTDRRLMTLFCKRWQTVYEQEKWLHDILSGKSNNPLLLHLIKASYNTFTRQVAKIEKEATVEAKDAIFEEVMIAAARCNKMTLLKSVLEKMDIDEKIDYGAAIRWAAANGHLAIVQHLAAKNPASLAKPQNDEYGWTAIMLAAQNGHLAVVRFLTKLDKNLALQTTTGSAQARSINVFRPSRSSPERYSYCPTDGNVYFAESNDPTTVSKRACIHSPRFITKFVNAPPTAEGWTAMISAAGNGHFDVVKYLTKIEPELLSKARADSWNPMMSAAENGHLDVVKFIGERNPECISNHLANACRSLIFSHGCPIGDYNIGWTPMHIAADNGHLDVVKYLAGKAPSCLIQAKFDGVTPVMLAAQNGHISVVKFIIECNKQALSNTVAWLAAKYDYLDVVKLIAEKDSEVLLSADKFGRTPFWKTAYSGSMEVAKFYLDKFDKDMEFLSKDNTFDGTTPLMTAAKNGNLEIVKILIQKDATLLSQVNKEGATPLWLAASSGSLDVVKWLAEIKPEFLSKANQQVSTPIMIAAANGHLDVVQFLASAAPQVVSIANNDKQTTLLVAKAK